MARYFLEVAYQGTNYAGFQKQQNANTIQSEIERALNIFYREGFDLTGSSRTDAGVHAYENYFHFDCSLDSTLFTNKSVYHLNAILPEDIVIKRIARVSDESHCRFDALSREYEYRIYQTKNPFLRNHAYYYPFPLNMGLLEEAAAIILLNKDFESFSKKNTQVHTYMCSIEQSNWKIEGDMIVYRVKGSRFLRGMVRGLVGTMLKLGTNKLDIPQFQSIIDSRDCTKVDFSVPGHGLTLVKVNYNPRIFEIPKK